jgi:hypothetical protein
MISLIKQLHGFSRRRLAPPQGEDLPKDDVAFMQGEHDQQSLVKYIIIQDLSLERQPEPLYDQCMM